MITKQLTDNTFKDKIVNHCNSIEVNKVNHFINNYKEKQLSDMATNQIVKLLMFDTEEEARKLDILNAALYEKIKNRLCSK